MQRMKPFLVIGSALCVLLLVACSEKLSRQTHLSDADLFARGQQRMAAKKYAGAIEAYQALLERFPNSALAAKAQLALAEARMANKDDIEAEVAYDDFLRLYPADENVPYALYKKGELLRRQARDPGRDQTKTLEAIRAFTQVREKNANGPYAAPAADRIRELRDRLARHEGTVISHYLTRKQYDSAEARARRAIGEYQDTGSVPALLSLLAESLDRQGKREEAAEVRKSLSEKFPENGKKKR